MTCILKSCANEFEPCCVSCEAQSVMDLSRRNDGFLASASSNPVLRALIKSAMVSTSRVCCGYVIVRAIVPIADPRPVTKGYHGNMLAHDHRGRWRSVETRVNA